MNTLKQSIITIIVCTAVVAGVSLVYSWTGPTATPPGGNVSAPINVGTTAQYKSGALSIGGLLQAPQIQLTTGAATGKVLTSDASGLASWQTGGTGGVSQIIAGTNITISPAGGTGAVTINSTGGGGGLTGSGSTNYVSKWTGATSLGNSSVIDYGSYIQVGALKFGLNSAVGSGPAFTVANDGITTAVRTDNFNVMNSGGYDYSYVWAKDYYISAIGKWASQLGGGTGSLVYSCPDEWWYGYNHTCASSCSGQLQLGSTCRFATGDGCNGTTIRNCTSAGHLVP